ncbi:MAG: cbb3-type cytochrome c oxidase N-terminal domain-containing protein [Sediminibacterium sp.]|nr:cbb3-type cytochrome c oxidase N-terminal domain-containing protein [Sediminibacterium sp.]TXT32415.1 MAG: cytochrome c oxidase cbb3-type subunit III [Chitinophagaceae bacterium]
MILKLKTYHQTLKGKAIRLMATVVFMISTISLFAQTTDAAAAPAAAKDVFYDSTFAYTLLGVTVLLAAVIYVLGNVFILAIRNKIAEEKKNGTINKALSLLIIFSVSSIALTAQTTAPVDPNASTVVSENVMYMIGTVLALEILIIFYFAFSISTFLKKEAAVAEEAKGAVPVAPVEKIPWFDRLYNRNTQEDIVKLDLGHDYDGIKELDNNIPIWWLYGAALSVVFAVVYLYSYHVAESRPLQQQELQIEQEIAAVKQAAYLEKSANNVDEKTVVMQDAAGIAAGKALFIKPGACATCHAENGGAIVNGAPGIGPNLTDDYWIHKGDIKSIFYSIKYGWPEKGMKSWKEDYSPIQMAQLASYVKSLVGTNPTPAKEKQGVLFVEESAAKPAVDTVKAK